MLTTGPRWWPAARRAGTGAGEERPATRWRCAFIAAKHSSRRPACRPAATPVHASVHPAQREASGALAAAGRGPEGAGKGAKGPYAKATCPPVRWRRRLSRHAPRGPPVRLITDHRSAADPLFTSLKKCIRFSLVKTQCRTKLSAGAQLAYRAHASAAVNRRVPQAQRCWSATHPFLSISLQALPCVGCHHLAKCSCVLAAANAEEAAHHPAGEMPGQRQSGSSAGAGGRAAKPALLLPSSTCAGGASACCCSAQRDPIHAFTANQCIGFQAQRCRTAIRTAHPGRSGVQ